MAKKKRVDPIKQREKRAKIAAGIGGLLFLAVAAYEVPSIMKMMNKKPPAAAASTTTTSTGSAGSIAIPDIAGGTTSAPSAGELANTDVPPAASSDGQLVSFGVFPTKDPFVPQISSSAASADASSAAGSTPGATTTPTTPTTTTTTPVTMTPLTPPATTTPTTPTGPTVSISVNGKVSKVGSQGTFPAGGAPVFRLASWQHGSAEIGIVGGSYATGTPTLTLKLNQPVTLQNTQSGKQYKLVLVSTP
jgi:hypothetical protein